MEKAMKEKKKFSAFEWVAMFLIAILLVTIIITAILIANLHDKKKNLEHENEQIQTTQTSQHVFKDFEIIDLDSQL